MCFRHTFIRDLVNVEAAWQDTRIDSFDGMQDNAICVNGGLW